MLLCFGSAFAQPLVQPTDYIICDDDNDGFAWFDLSTKTSEILGTLNPETHIVTYHFTESGASNGEGEMPDELMSGTDPYPVYVRVVAEGLPVDDIMTFNLIVANSPAAVDLHEIVIVEGSFDGIANFDLTSNAADLLGSQTGIDLSYYISMMDAQMQVNAIASASAFTNSINPQPIWVRATNAVSGCSNVFTFNLAVLPDAIVNIPDAAFKAKLVAASPSYQVGSTVNPNSGATLDVFTTIDTNSDGEIQYVEAYQIIFLSLGISDDIVNMQGIEAFTNLEQLYCNNNAITSLDVSMLTSLNYLNCENNQISTISLPNGLTGLSCSDNLISNLDLAPLTSLTTLYAHHNLLTSLDLSNIPGIWIVNAGYNNLTNFTLSDKNDLASLYLGYNQITNVELNNLPHLYQVNVQDNLLTEIDLSDCAYQPSLNNVPGGSAFIIGLNNNLGLTYINLKNGYVNSNIELSTMSFAENVQYICIDEEEDVPTDNWFVNDGSQTSTYCNFTPGGNFNTISGTLLYDLENNGCDASDLPQSFIKMHITNGTEEGYAFTTSTGNYGFFTQDGTFTMTPQIENMSFFNFSPNNANVTFPDNNNNTATENFCVSANGIHNDIEVVIAPIVPARPGFDAIYKVVYKNNGNQVLSGNVTFTYDDSVLDLISASTAPDASAAGSLAWNYSNLNPFESRAVVITLNVNAPTEVPAVNIDDNLAFSATASLSGADESPADNNFDLNQVVVGSFDPNDKKCVEGDVVAPTEIGGYLHYVINFENTGNFIAENIVVEDIINPDQFDISTLQVMHSSHPANARISGNKAEFIFDGINLGIGGHGNILLKVKTRESIIVGESVSNRANIYFDYNYPIETNNATTAFVALGIGNNEIGAVEVYPNPVREILNIKMATNIKSVEIFDIQGRLLQTKIFDKQTAVIDMADKDTGVYFLRITSENGVHTEKIIKK
jgi:hypothetical protein